MGKQKKGIAKHIAVSFRNDNRGIGVRTAGPTSGISDAGTGIASLENVLAKLQTTTTNNKGMNLLGRRRPLSIILVCTEFAMYVYILEKTESTRTKEKKKKKKKEKNGTMKIVEPKIKKKKKKKMMVKEEEKEEEESGKKKKKTARTKKKKQSSERSIGNALKFILLKYKKSDVSTIWRIASENAGPSVHSHRADRPGSEETYRQQESKQG